MNEHAAGRGRREVEDLWWLHDSLASLLGERPDGDMIRVGVLRRLLKTTAPETTTPLPPCEGWICQSCGADNFIPAGFARHHPAP